MSAAATRRLLLALVLLVLGSLAAGCVGAIPAYRYPNLPRHGQGATHFIVFDVGQADAMLVLHGDKTMLVDAGASRDKNSRQSFRDIARRLEAITGRRHLDYVLITHYHADHLGMHGRGRSASMGELGLWGLLADERVTVGTLIDRGAFVIGPKGATQRAYERSLPHWLRQSVGQRQVAREGMLIELGPGLKVEIVAVNGAGRLMEIRQKKKGFFRRYPPSENDYSIALRFTVGDFAMFSAGDMSGVDAVRNFGTTSSSYNDIESRIAARVGDVEVYRVSHHGSDHSSNPCFIRVLNPEVSIFSTGDNGYGHPALRVYDALRRISRVIITGGADKRVYGRVKQDIAHGPVEVVVEPGGAHYYVEGARYRSLTAAEERARPDFLTGCEDQDRAEDEATGASGQEPED